MRWDILLSITIVVATIAGIIIYLSAIKFTPWKRPQIPVPPSTAPVPPVEEKKKDEKKKEETKPTASATDIGKVWSEWWAKRWPLLIAISIAYAIFWGCLLWAFPNLRGLSREGMIIFFGLIFFGVIGFALPRSSLTIVCLSLLTVISIGACGRLNDKGYLPEPKPKAETRATPSSQAVPLTSSASVTLSAKDGWVPIRVFGNGGKTWVSKVIPQTTTVVVRTPNGRVHKAGYGHRDDVWSAERLPQTWFIATDEETSVTYIVTWSN